MASEFTTMKVRRTTKRLFSSYKGRLIAEKSDKLSDDEALLEILGRLQEKALAQKSGRIDDLIGFIKTGKKYDSAKEIDKVVYGL